MVRFVLAAVILFLRTPAFDQPSGTVLTDSEIQYPHLMHRPVTLEGREWLGLWADDGGSRIEPIDVRWVGALEFEDSVFTLETRPAAPTLVLGDVPGITVGAVTSLSRFEQGLSPGEAVAYTLGSRTYTLEVSGIDPMLCDAAVTLSDRNASQGLYFPDYDFLSCDEPHFSVQWAGDLDGDGRLDLVVTFSQKYSYYPRRLFLSSLAREGALVGLAAAFDGTAA